MALFFVCRATSVLFFVILSVVSSQNVSNEDPVVPSPQPTVPDTEVNYLGRKFVEDANGAQCLLAEISGQVNVSYVCEDGSKKVGSIPFNQSKTWLDGTCSDKTATITLEWGSKKYKITMTIQKGDMSWFISDIKFDYSTEDTTVFKDIKESGPHNTASLNNVKLMETLLGDKYYSCSEGAPLTLTSDNTETTVTIQLKNVKIKPFTTGDEWGKGIECGREQRRSLINKNTQDRSGAAIAVGICLALVAVGVVVGYAGRRYYREKIAYNTM